MFAGAQNHVTGLLNGPDSIIKGKYIVTVAVIYHHVTSYSLCDR